MPGLKTGVENAIFWSQIGSGFGEPGGTPHQQFPGVSPLPRPPLYSPSLLKKIIGSPVLGRTSKGNLKNRMSLTLRNLD